MRFLPSACSGCKSEFRIALGPKKTRDVRMLKTFVGGKLVFDAAAEGRRACLLAASHAGEAGH